MTSENIGRQHPPPQRLSAKFASRSFTCSNVSRICNRQARISGQSHLSRTSSAHDHNDLALTTLPLLRILGLWSQIHTRSIDTLPHAPRPRLVQRQLLRYRREQLLHVLGGLGAGLEEEETGFAGVLLGV